MIKSICIFPARGGSKRLKNKNIKNFLGKPIISYPIKAAKKSRLFSRIIVSTESKNIAAIAKKCGAEVPFLRVKNLADDFTVTRKVLVDVVKRLKLEHIKYLFCIYPTSALIETNDLKKAFKVMKSNNYDILRTVSNFNSNPLRALVIKKNNTIKYFWKKFENYRTQDLPKFYYETGVFSIYNISSMLKNKKDKVGSFFLKNTKSIDIDTLDDLKLAKILYKFQKKKSKS